MPDENKEDWQPGHKPTARDALILLLASAACAGLFYLWLGEFGASLVYGAMLGCALAAIGAEFYKFSRAYRADNPASSVAAAMRSLAGQSFRIGFLTTFKGIVIELFKLVGIKILVSVVIALTALFIAGRHHLF